MPGRGRKLVYEGGQERLLDEVTFGWSSTEGGGECHGFIKERASQPERSLRAEPQHRKGSNKEQGRTGPQRGWS